MKKTSTYFHFLIFVIFFPQNCENRKVLKLQNIKCLPFDKGFADFTECNLKAVSRSITEVNIHVALKRTPVSNITIYGSCRRRGFNKIPPILENLIDGCAFMRNKRRNILAKIVYEVFGLGKYSNLNHSCPYDHDVIVKNWRWTDGILDNLPIPNGAYDLLTSWRVFNIVKANITIAFRFYDA